MTIFAHTLFKNEERWLWYSVTSVIDHVDKLLLWDTGSTDNSWEIAKLLKVKYNNKIDLKQFGEVTPESFPKVRQEMLDTTNADWFITADADEIWWSNSIRNLTKAILDIGNNIESIYTPAILPVGDMSHFLEEKAGRYKLGGRLGHFGLKAINRKIPGLSSLNPHGSWGWVDENKKMIQDRDQNKLLFVNAPFMHTSFLQRSINKDQDKKVPKRDKKYKFEIGNKFPLDYYYPEVFFEPRPSIVNSVWNTMDFNYKIKAIIQTPFKKIIRRLI